MKKISYVLTILVEVTIVYGQGSSTGSSYLLLPYHARPAALAQAVVADAGTFSSIFINPAAIGMGNATELLLSHTEWIQDVRMETLGTRLPFDFGTLGLAVTTSSVEGIHFRERPGLPEASFTARFSTLQATYAYSLFDDLWIGAGAKYIHEKIFVDEATGYALDFGLIYSTPIEGLNAGVAFTNIGEMSAFRLSNAELPTSVQAGTSYTWELEEFAFTAAANIRNVARQEEMGLHLALEGRYRRFASLRIGYQSSSDVRSLSGGIGLSYHFLNLDYAYVPFLLRLGDGHILSLRFLL